VRLQLLFPLPYLLKGNFRRSQGLIMENRICKKNILKNEGVKGGHHRPRNTTIHSSAYPVLTLASLSTPENLIRGQGFHFLPMACWFFSSSASTSEKWLESKTFLKIKWHGDLTSLSHFLFLSDYLKRYRQSHPLERRPLP
jgi:hypothetical protein